MAISSPPALARRLPFGETWLSLEPHGDTRALDAMDVRGRMTMYRLLVERANRRGAFGPEHALSPLWGYASQLAWQHASGRLGGAGTSIDPESWWGACNYALSVVPYVAAAQLALVPELGHAPPAAWAPALVAWRAAFTEVWALPAGAELDGARVAIWRAHLASIRLAVARHEREYLALPAGERRFAAGWIRMVDLFGAAAVRTDLERLTGPAGAAALPASVLPGVLDVEALPRGQRGVVRRVVALGDRPAWRWAIELRAWQRAMRSRAARAEAEDLLAAALGRGTWPVKLRGLAYVALPGPLVGLLR